MKYLLVSIKDNAIEAFQPIATVRAKGEAIRSFQDATNNQQNSQLYNHPEDFDLYLIGEFDDTTGYLKIIEHERLARGADYKDN